MSWQTSGCLHRSKKGRGRRGGGSFVPCRPCSHQFVTPTASGSPPRVFEAVKVHSPGRISGEHPLHEGQQPLQALQILPSCFIIHNVGCIHGVPNLLSGAPIVNTDACHTNRPRVVPWRQYILFL